MFALLDKYFITFILLVLGLIIVILTYRANMHGRSGLPVVGGLLIAIGFLLSPIKWLAILGIFDYGPSYLAYLYVSEALVTYKFKAECRKNGYREKVEDKSLCFFIRVPEINEELIKPYVTNTTIRYFVPKCFFYVCIDRDGKHVLLLDRCKGDKKIDIIPFTGKKVSIEGLKHKLNYLTIEIEIKDSADLD